MLILKKKDARDIFTIYQFYNVKKMKPDLKSLRQQSSSCLSQKRQVPC